MLAYAPFSKRFLAACIDNVLSFAFLGTPALFYYLNDKSFSFLTAVVSLLLTISWPVFTLYNTVYLTGIQGASIGKRIAGIAVMDKAAFEPLGFWRAYVRQLSKKLSWIPLGAGYLWMLIDSDKQTWHDKIAGSKVYAKQNITTPLPALPSGGKTTNPAFFKRNINLIAALSISFMFTMLILLIHVSTRIIPPYITAFRYSNIALSQFTILAINISVLIRKIRLFFVLASPAGILIFLFSEDKRFPVFIGITVGLVFILLASAILFAIQHPHSILWL